MRLIRALLNPIFLLLINFLSAQEIETRDFKVMGEEIQLSFVVEPDHSIRERYNVTIYASHDDYSEPLALDIHDVVPNELTTVSFSIVEKIGYYQGQLQFKLEAEASVFPVEILNRSTKKFRKNKKYEVHWEDQNDSGEYDIKLYHKDTIIALAETVVGHTYSGQFPKTIDPGKFSIVVSPSNNPHLASDEFPITIRRNITTVVVLVAVLVGGTGYLILNNSGGEGPGGAELPDPPGTPN